jgi:hypothetical protein
MFKFLFQFGTKMEPQIRLYVKFFSFNYDSDSGLGFEN